MHKDCTQTMTRSEPLNGLLHSFHFRFEILGLLATAHYNKFLAYSDTAVPPSPLNALLCSDTFWRWSKEREEAFQVSKQVLTSADVLAHFNPHLPQLSTNRWSVYTYCFLQICESLSIDDTLEEVQISAIGWSSAKKTTTLSGVFEPVKSITELQLWTAFSQANAKKKPLFLLLGSRNYQEAYIHRGVQRF